MNELALFAGAGGGILGGGLLGWRTVCAVERDAYAAQILAQRQNDGILETFPIWSDVCSFDGTRWRGIVDVVSGGFPCQDISAAGKGAGIEGERSGMWKEMARIIGEIQPRYAFVENSPMLTTRGLGTVLADLAEMGFNAEWGVLSAADVGANHERERIWILAENTKQSGFFSHTKHDRNGWWEQQQESIKETDGAMADTRCKHGGKRNATRVDTNTQKRTTSTVHNQSSRERFNQVSDASSQRQHGQREFVKSMRTAQKADWQADIIKSIGKRSQWQTEPNVGRVADGVAFSMDRLKAIGNGQVPLCAATAFKLLKARLDK